MKYYQQIDKKMRIEWNSLQKRIIYNKGEMELERPVSESHFLLQKIVCLDRFLFTLVRKNGIR